MSLTGLFPIDQWNFNSHFILAELPPADLDGIFKNAREKKYVKGEFIFREGAVPTGIFFIKEGKVKKYKCDGHNKEHIIYVASTGELVGYHAVLAFERYPDSASAIQDSVIAHIPKTDFLKIVEQSPALSRTLLKTLGHEFAVLVNNVSIFAQKPVRERLAITLIILREKYKADTQNGQPIFIEVGREDIASMAGTARENVVRLLREFKDEQIIETKGRKILVTNIKKLVAISNFK
jgi:CRP-like cAMP-binding protein